GLAIVAAVIGMGIESIAAAMLVGELAAYIALTRRISCHVLSIDTAGLNMIWPIAALLTVLWVGVNIIWPDVKFLRFAATLVATLGSIAIIMNLLREKRTDVGGGV
ncbi:MAG: hypothetical protein IID18_07690, partial [Nitrospinae bacterium]|nr:hypothetical protein [Nitrospinota bacterium]